MRKHLNPVRIKRPWETPPKKEKINPGWTFIPADHKISGIQVPQKRYSYSKPVSPRQKLSSFFLNTGVNFDDTEIGILRHSTEQSQNTFLSLSAGRHKSRLDLAKEQHQKSKEEFIAREERKAQTRISANLERDIFVSPREEDRSVSSQDNILVTETKVMTEEQSIDVEGVIKENVWDFAHQTNKPDPIQMKNFNFELSGHSVKERSNAGRRKIVRTIHSYAPQHSTTKSRNSVLSELPKTITAQRLSKFSQKEGMRHLPIYDDI